MLNKSICIECKKNLYEEIYKNQTEATKEILLENFILRWDNKGILDCHIYGTYRLLIVDKDEPPVKCSYLLEQLMGNEIK